MRSNRTLKSAIGMLGFFTSTANGYAGSSSGGGMGRGIDLSSGGNSGIGVGEVAPSATHSYSSEIATPGTSHTGNPATNFGNLAGLTEPYSTGRGDKGGKSGHDDITMLGKDAGLSSSGSIKPIDPGLDMTKIGRLDAPSPEKGRHYDGSQATADSLDREVKDFDASSA